MTEQHGGDEGAAADLALIAALANGLRLHRRPGDPDTIVELGDSEVTRLLARRPGGHSFETTERGKRSIEAVFSTARDARRALMMDLCWSYLASYQHVDGLPLFDLGIPADEWNLHRRRPKAKVMGPETETPPPDEEGPPGWSSAGPAATPPSRRTTAGAGRC
jgi:hypothetical protein